MTEVPSDLYLMRAMRTLTQHVNGQRVFHRIMPYVVVVVVFFPPSLALAQLSWHFVMTTKANYAN